jgi:hypothetical protein
MCRQLSRQMMATVAVICGLLAAVGCAARRGPAVPAPEAIPIQIPEPLKIASPEVVGYLAVPDLKTAMDRIEEIAAEFAPDRVERGTLKEQLGQMLGDPNLAYLDSAMPLVVMVLRADTPTEPPPVAAFMTYTKEQPYAETAERWGAESRIVNDVLIVSNAYDTLDTAEELVPLYRDIRTAALTSDLRLTFCPGRLTEIYGDTVRGWIDRMVGLMGALAVMGQPGAGPEQGARLGKILKLEMNAGLALLADVDVVQSDVTLDTEAITVNRIVVGRRGSRLAELFNGPAVGENYAVELLSAPGFVMYAAQVDPGRLSDFIVDLLRRLSEDPDAAEILTPEVVALYEDMDTWLTGDMAVSVRSTSESPLVSENAMGITDAEKGLAVVERGISLMAPGSAFNKMYQEMGMNMSMTLEKEVRYHAGVPVHRLNMSLEMPAAPEEWATQMRGMMKDTEFAFAGGYYLAAQDPTVLDGAIDRALDAARTAAVMFHARDLFGPGHHVYVDVEFVGLMRALMATIPSGMPNPLEPLLEQVTSAEPIAYAMAWSGGRAQDKLRIPLSPFIEIAAAARGTGRGQ